MSLWSWIFLLPLMYLVFIYTFQFSCWITQVIQGWHGLIIHRWKHPDVASLSLCPLVVFGTLWTGCDNIIDVITLFGVIDIGRCWPYAHLRHTPLPGRVYNGQCGRDHWWPVSTPGVISPSHVTDLGQNLATGPAGQTQPPLLDADHEAVLVTRPSWYNKHLCQVFCCDQQSFIVRMLLSWSWLC